MGGPRKYSYWNHNTAFHDELVADAARRGGRALDVLGVAPIRLASLWHHETRDIGVPTAAAHESLHQIRVTARRALPGARVRRRFYWRYSLVWDRPGRQQR